jgi:DNA-binding response OmpR family regulator
MGYAILIVDDDPAIGELFGKILVRRGYVPLIVDSAKEAIDIFRQQSVDLVLSDLDLPGMNGFQLCGRLKSIRPEVPVVLMTSFGDRTQGLRAYEEGACYFLSKPLNMDTLLGCVQNLLPDLESSTAQHA